MKLSAQVHCSLLWTLPAWASVQTTGSMHAQALIIRESVENHSAVFQSGSPLSVCCLYLRLSVSVSVCNQSLKNVFFVLKDELFYKLLGPVCVNMLRFYSTIHQFPIQPPTVASHRRPLVLHDQGHFWSSWRVGFSPWVLVQSVVAIQKAQDPMEVHQIAGASPYAVHNAVHSTYGASDEIYLSASLLRRLPRRDQGPTNQPAAGDVTSLLWRHRTNSHPASDT